MAWFHGWDIHAAHEGRLDPWTVWRGEAPNNLWLRRDLTAPWVLDLTVGEGTDTEWVYRRDAVVRRPWREAILTSRTGVPYLAPELQLLFKSKHLREKDTMDAERVIPELVADQRNFLINHLPEDHAWQQLLR